MTQPETTPEQAIEQCSYWAETGTAGSEDGCNKPFWLKHEAVAYVRQHGGYCAPLYRLWNLTPDEVAAKDAEIERLRAELAAQNWQPIETAPKDGTWILGMNSAKNCAVIIWSKNPPKPFGKLTSGWVHPYTEGYLSEFWNGSCGSTATHWMPLPTPPQPEK